MGYCTEGEKYEAGQLIGGNLQTYVVKNNNDYPIELQFTDDSNVTVGPGGIHLWIGPEEVDPTIEMTLISESLELWTIGHAHVVPIDQEDEGLEFWKGQDPMFWKQEGF